MNEIPADVLLELIGVSVEPLAVLRVDSPDWPVVFANPAFEALAEGRKVAGIPFPDILGPMIGRDMTREASAALRAIESSSLPVDVGSREFLLVLVPIVVGEQPATYVGAYLRTAGRHLPSPAGTESFRALVHATRRLRSLSGDDSVTGLTNERAFRQILDHDWAVAGRERSTLGLTAFKLDDFDAYLGVFGRHGADSCLRRVARIISRCLRRASDVAARVDGPGGGAIVALTHGSDEKAQEEFAAHIAGAVRDLGLHHPRSKVDRFVTVSWRTGCYQPGESGKNAGAELARLLQRLSGPR